LAVANRTKVVPHIEQGVWDDTYPLLQEATALSKDLASKWAEIAAKITHNHRHADWRYLLKECRERCEDDPKLDSCPYSVTYLIQLAETYNAVGKKRIQQRKVPVSVLVEGRNLDNLKEVLDDEDEKPKLSVTRMKAHVAKQTAERAAKAADAAGREVDEQTAADVEKSVDEIEEEIKADRTETRDGNTRRNRAERIEGIDIEKAHKVLPDIRTDAQAYANALIGLQATGAEFDTSEVAKTLRAVKELANVLKDIGGKSLKRAA
jgi:hypothetical protein